MASAASKDRAAVEDSLRRFGFGERGIAAVLENEERIAAGLEAKRKAKPVEPTALDFGDWCDSV